ncbi:MAG: hypothetical protein ACT4N9_01720 [Paracoccaceae bacterium]
MKPALILHVGMDKTGTTAIQSALDRACRSLASEHGVLVPRTGSWSDHSHHRFAFAAFGINGYSFADLAGLLASLEDEVTGAGCGRVLLSSECLYNLPGKPGMEAFMAGLRRIFGAIRVIVYLRRQDTWVESRYRHSVVSGREIPLGQLCQPRYADYLPPLDRWAEVVGLANMVVRPYETAQFPMGDIAADFAQAAGLPAGALPSLRGIRANAALSFEVVQLRAAFNHLRLPQETTGDLNEVLAHAVAGGPAERFFVSPRQAAQLVERYSESNRQIALRYMGRMDGRAFVDPPPAAGAHAVPEIGRARMIEILGTVRQRKPELLRRAARAGDELRLADLRFREAAAQVWTLVSALRDMGIGGEVAAAARSAPLPGARPAAREIFVHFGVYKTGSSAIQETLFNHAAGLSDGAYLGAGVANHSLLVRTAVLVAKRAQERFAPGDSLEKVQQRKEHAAERLQHALAAAAPAGRVILSAEAICGFTARELETLKDFLTPHAEQIRFFGYMRDPVTLTASVFQEQLKSRRPVGFTFGQGGEPGPPLLYRVVDRLDALFGAAAVTVFPFDPATFPGGDVVRHFLAATGIRGEGLEPVRSNESLNLLAVKALYSYRHLRSAAESPDLGKSRAAFISDLRGLRGPSFGFHPDINARIRANCGDWDDWAARRLGRPLAYLSTDAQGGIRTEADLLTFSDQDLAELARYGERHGINAITAASGAEDVADLVQRVRQRFARGIAD